MPNPAHVNISAAGVAKSAKNKKEAIQFIEFLSKTSVQDPSTFSGAVYDVVLHAYRRIRIIRVLVYSYYTSSVSV